MTTPLRLKGLTTGGFFPSPDATNPDYSVAGEVQPVTCDVYGFQNIRGPVVTDEGGFREMFAVDPFGAAPWTTLLTSGTRVVAAGVATFTSGLVVGGRNYVCRVVDFMPMIVNVELVASTARGVGGETIEFFWGLYSDSDPDVAIATGEFYEQSWLWSDATATGRARGGVGGFYQGPTTFGITSSSTNGFRTITMDGEGCVWRDGATTIPTPTVRNTFSTKMPGIYTTVNFCMGFRNGATPGVSRTVTVTTLYIKNTDRLLVNTAF